MQVYIILIIYRIYAGIYYINNILAGPVKISQNLLS